MITRRFVIAYADTPHSLNAGGTGSRRHWAVGYREKRRWEGIYQGLLMAEGVPRWMTHCTVSVLLQFREQRTRDPENYRSSVSKPLADALVKGRWLPDDSEEFFRVASFEVVSPVLLDGRSKSRMAVWLTARYEERG